jgi:class 3 adenylate cyclase
MGHVRPDHVYLLLSVPPHVAPSRVIPAIKGKTSHHLFMLLDPLELLERSSRPRAPAAPAAARRPRRTRPARSALEGEREHVTVLFCDVADSTALPERPGPEAMHALLNRFFELSLAEVHRYEGSANTRRKRVDQESRPGHRGRAESAEPAPGEAAAGGTMAARHPA